MTFCCGYCPARYGEFTDLVTHYEKRHSDLGSVMDSLEESYSEDVVQAFSRATINRMAFLAKAETDKKGESK